MRRIAWRVVAMTMAVVSLSCKHPLKPDEVDTSVPQPASANEPAGFKPIANRGFLNLVEDNWIWGGDLSAWALRSEPDAPQSKPSVARITLPAGFASGASPVHLERNLRENDHFYLNTWIRVSDNWKPNQIQDAMMAIWGGGKPRIFWGWRPDSTGERKMPNALILTEGVPGGSLWLDPNVVKDAAIKVNQWHHIEIEVRTTGGTNGNGRFVCWLDGVKISSYDDVPYGLPAGQRWAMIQVGPTWGGLTEPLDQSQWVEFDHLYMSAPQ